MFAAKCADERGVVRAVGIEPTLLSEPDFESGASTSFTTPAWVPGSDRGRAQLTGARADFNPYPGNPRSVPRRDLRDSPVGQADIAGKAIRNGRLMDATQEARAKKHRSFRLRVIFATIKLCRLDREIAIFRHARPTLSGTAAPPTVVPPPVQNCACRVIMAGPISWMSVSDRACSVIRAPCSFDVRASSPKTIHTSQLTAR